MNFFILVEDQFLSGPFTKEQLGTELSSLSTLQKVSCEYPDYTIKYDTVEYVKFEVLTEGSKKLGVGDKPVDTIILANAELKKTNSDLYWKNYELEKRIKELTNPQPEPVVGVDKL